MNTLLEREPLLAIMLAARDRAASGRGGTMLIEGEAGKTSLLQAFAAAASDARRRHGQLRRPKLIIIDGLFLGVSRLLRIGHRCPQTLASPAVVSSAAHGLSAGDAVVFNVPPNTTAATISAANPAVVTMANSFVAGQPVKVSSTGSLPYGIHRLTIPAAKRLLKRR